MRVWGLFNCYPGKGEKLTQPKGNGVFLWEVAILGRELSVWGGAALDTETSWGGLAVSP